MRRFQEWGKENRDKLLLGFLGFNFLAMALDCTLAHWSIGFYHWGMYLSAVMPIPAGLIVLFYAFRKPEKIGRTILRVIAWISLMTGLLGLVWHLLGQFYIHPGFSTIIYSAPILGPVALTVIGLVLCLYLRPPKVGLFKSFIILTSVVFLGITLMAYLDHAQNGFYSWTEWVPVLSGVFAVVIFFYYGLRPPVERAGWNLLMGTAGASLAVGIIGTLLHLIAFINHAAPLREKFALLAPPMAPVILCDAAIFALLVLMWFEGDPDPVKKV